MAIRPKHVVSNSSGMNLHFPDTELFSQYQEVITKVNKRFYQAIRDKYGVWATNQDKFIPVGEPLGDLDSNYMEGLINGARNDNTTRKMGSKAAPNK